MGHHKEHTPHHERDFKVGKKDSEKKSTAAKTAPASEKTEPHHDEELAGIRAQQDRLLKRLHELKAAGSDALIELKSGAENAFDELKGSVQKVITRFESALHHDHGNNTKH